MILKSITTAKNNIKMQSVLTFVSLLTNTVAFFLLSVFLSFALLSNFLLSYLESKAQMTVFFLDTTTEEYILDVRNELLEFSYINNVNYISKDQAYEIFLELVKSEPALQESADPVQLPASLDISVSDVTYMDKAVEFLETKEGIEEVRYFEEALKTFKNWSNGVKYVGLLIISLLMLQSFLIVLIITGVSIRDKSEEIRIMKLLGATNWYIEGPFYAQAFIISLLSSFFSMALFLAIIPFAEPFINQSFVGVPVPSVTFLGVSILFGVVFVTNLLLSTSGTFVALKKYIRI